MNGEIAAILAMDGIASGAIYVLIGLGLVLIFAVTRVIFVPFGDIAAFTALTLASLETGSLPGTVGLVAVLAVLATVMEGAALSGAGALHRLPRALLFYLVLPLVPAAAVWFAAGTRLSMPRGSGFPSRWCCRSRRCSTASSSGRSPMPRSCCCSPSRWRCISRLSGLGLMFFGPEGVRTKPLTDAVFDVVGLIVNAQTLLIVGGLDRLQRCCSSCSSSSPCTGKALRATAVNRTGARLVGIRPAATGTIAYLLASLLAGISGVLIAPVTTIFYNSGFLIGLKAFVGAIIGAMASYPVTALGAVLVGLLESFASFWSSAYKEVVVFSVSHPRPAVALAELRVGPRGRGRGMTRAQFGLLGGAILLLALAPLCSAPFSITLLNYIGIYALAVLGLVLLTGIGGMLSFGQAAFVGIAAYATAWLTARAGYSPWLGLAWGSSLTGVAASRSGAVTLRLGGHFLSLSTIAWGLSIYFLFGNLPMLGQFNGISEVPPISIGRLRAVEQRSIYYLIWGVPDRGPDAGGEPARFARGPGDPRAARRPDHGGKPGHHPFRIKLVTFVIARLLSALVGLALRASEPLRQPGALRRQRRHPLSADGDGRRGERPHRRRGRRRHRDVAEERHPGLSADDRPGRLGAARNRRVLGAVHPVAAACARRHRAVRRCAGCRR